MSPQLTTALIRASLGGIITAGVAFFGQLAAGVSVGRAGIATGLTFFTYLAARGGAEGLIDQRNSGAHGA